MSVYEDRPDDGFRNLLADAMAAAAPTPSASEGEPPVTAQSRSAKAADSDPPTATGLGIRSVAELVTHTLRGLHRCNGHFVRMKATLGDDGYITVDATRVYLDGDDATVRVLLHPTGPVPVVPQPLAEIGPGPSAT